MTAITPFSVTLTPAIISDLRQRLQLTRLPEAETVADWTQGLPLNYCRELLDYWQNHYDMERLAQRLNIYPQFTTDIDGLSIHFLHVRSPRADATPLLLTHGWPGSVVEFLKVIPGLTHPAADQPAFHVICPSLPGFGFSGKPATTGWNLQRIARAWAELMARLGYDRYFAQGGDWGSGVTSALAQVDSKCCLGIHLNMATVIPPAAEMTDLTAAEQASLASLQHYKQWDSGYSTQQGTRPQTIGYSLTDSPAGLLAWIAEKYWAWTDCDGDPENALSKDEMLDNIMVYWVSASGASAARIYWESMGAFTRGEVTVPSGFSIFPREIFRSSRRWSAAVFTNIVYWNEVDKGGHFAAFEQPERFIRELQQCFGGMLKQRGKV
jgi:pimeloyl-ACP methyl ester carboxylesterase